MYFIMITNGKGNIYSLSGTAVCQIFLLCRSLYKLEFGKGASLYEKVIYVDNHHLFIIFRV